MQIENLLKRIPDSQHVKNIKHTTQFIQIEEQYSQLLNEVSAETLSYYRSKLSNIELLLYDIVCKESKDVEAIYRLGIVTTINYGSTGLNTFTELLVALYEDLWEELDPKSDVKDSDYIKLNMLCNFSNKIIRWANEFIFFSSSTNYNLVYFLSTASSGSLKSEIQAVFEKNIDVATKSVKNLRQAISNLIRLEQIAAERCNDSNEEDAYELNVTFKEFISQTESVLLIMEEVVGSLVFVEQSATGRYDAFMEENHDTEINKSVEIVRHHANLLIKTKKNKLLGHSLIYCINSLDVDSMQLMSNMRNNELLASFIQYIIDQNEDQ